MRLFLKDIRLTILQGYLLSILGKFLGYLRYLAIAYFFGASGALDVFWLVLSIGSFFPGIVESGVHIGGVPVLKEVEARRGEKDTYELLANINLLLIFLGLFILLFYPLVLPKIISKTAVGFKKYQQELVLPFTLFLLPYFLARTFKASCEVWAIYREQYILREQAELPSFLFSLLVLLFVLVYTTPFWVGVSYSLGLVVYCLIMIWALRPFPIIPPKKVPEIRKIVKYSMAAVLVTGTGFVYEITDKIFASLLPTGAITIIMLAQTILYNFMGSTISIFSRIALTKISDDVLRNQEKNIKLRYYYVVSIISLYFLPLFALLWFVAPLISRVLFAYGHFTLEDSIKISHAIRGYLIGMPLTYIEIFFNVYSRAIQHPFILVPTAYIATVLNVIFDWLLVLPLKEFGIALATSCVQIMKVIMSFLILKKYLKVSAFSSLKLLLKGYFLAGILVAFYVLIMQVIANQIICAVLGSMFLGFLWWLAEKVNLFPLIPLEWRVGRWIEMAILKFSKR